MATGGPTPLRPKAQAGPSATTPLWCEICHVGGNHNTYNCHLLPQFNQTPQQLFCNFCILVGHEERDCRRYQLLMDESPTYRMQAEVRSQDSALTIAQGGLQGRGRGWGGMGSGRGREQRIYYNCGGPRDYTWDCTNPTRISCTYCEQFDHELIDCPTLIA